MVALIDIPIQVEFFGTLSVEESLLFKGAGLGTTFSFMVAVATLSPS